MYRVARNLARRMGFECYFMGVAPYTWWLTVAAGGFRRWLTNVWAPYPVTPACPAHR
ncbi:MAG: hypothetical protein AB1609_00925 [Bacillota bacterium]